MSYFFSDNKPSERQEWVNTILVELKHKPIVILQGLRRVGKTKIMDTIAVSSEFRDYEKIIFDTREFGIDISSEAKKILDKARSAKKPTLILIDEFQEIEGWSDLLFQLYKLKDYVKVLTSGSVSANIDLNNQTEGGRFTYFNITPLSYREYKDMGDESRKLFGDDELFDRYATMGSYPDQEFNENIIAYKRMVTYNVLEKTRDSSLLKRASIDDPQQVASVFRWIIENIGDTHSTNSISKSLGINSRTVDKIINYLKCTYLIYEINNEILGAGRGSQINRKFYLVDHSFYLYLNKNKYESIDDDLFKNHIFENIIINQVRAVYDRSETEIKFLIKKGTTSEIVDIDMITNNGEVKYFEIKNTNKSDSLSKGQKAFALENKLHVIYLGETKEQNGIQYINYIEFIKGVKKWI